MAAVFLGDGKSQMHIQILIIVFNKINQLSYTLINNNKRIINDKKKTKKKSGNTSCYLTYLLNIVLIFFLKKEK